MISNSLFYFRQSFYLLSLFYTLGLGGLEEKERLLIAHVEQSINQAMLGESKLTAKVMNLAGMSSPKVRHLLNNLCSMPQTRYLEIGSWKGSTWISALFKNSETIAEAISIDNWSEFGGEAKFKSNCNRFLSDIPYKTYSADCFTLDIHAICQHPINIYFYDGYHSALAQEMAFSYYNDIFDDVFIAIVDDWNWQEVQEGTHAAFEKLNYKVLYERAMPAKWDEKTEKFDVR